MASYTGTPFTSSRNSSSRIKVEHWFSGTFRFLGLEQQVHSLSWSRIICFINENHQKMITGSDDVLDVWVLGSTHFWQPGSLVIFGIIKRISGKVLGQKSVSPQDSHAFPAEHFRR